jgi:hypothetical protein
LKFAKSAAPAKNGRLIPFPHCVASSSLSCFGKTSAFGKPNRAADHFSGARDLRKAQWKAQNEVEVKFGLRQSGEVAQLWILNYGLANIVLTKIMVEMPERKRITIYKNSVVRPGRKRLFDLPHRQWSELSQQQNIQVTVFCESTTEQFQETKLYTLCLTDRSQVYKVKKGLRGLWMVGCPKCDKFLGICMVTDGLKDLDEARQRQKEMEAEVAGSCPQHASKWMLTMENVTQEAVEES